MQRSDMNDSQRRDWQLFNLLLESYGWEDIDDTEWRMEQGESCTPEGHRARRHGHTLLEARLHAPVNMISLRLSEPQHNPDNIQLHFLYDDRPERILEWIVAHAEQLTIEAYQPLLSSAQRQCEMILLEKSDMEIYEVKPST